MCSRWWGMLVGKVWVRDLREGAMNRAPTVGEGSYSRRALDEIERIVIHHVGGGVNRDYTAAEIADYHVRTREWPGIAYHFLAHPDGRLEYVGDMATVRYHVGQINRSSIGICLAGDFMAEAPRRVCLLRVAQLVGGIWRELGRKVPVVGHCEVGELTGYGATACPGNTWNGWRYQVVGGPASKRKAFNADEVVGTRE